jgi:hypothetical protein
MQARSRGWDGAWERWWEDLRPRFVRLTLRVGRRSIRWWAPLWPFEETLRFGLLALPWIAYAWRRAPPAWRGSRAGSGRDQRGSSEPLAGAPWSALEALLAGHGQGLLRLPPGEPFVQIEAGDRHGAVRIEITQV